MTIWSMTPSFTNSNSPIAHQPLNLFLEILATIQLNDLGSYRDIHISFLDYTT
jgi:hypothetical protein